MRERGPENGAIVESLAVWFNKKRHQAQASRRCYASLKGRKESIE
jgi:hypothetical protein